MADLDDVWRILVTETIVQNQSLSGDKSPNKVLLFDDADCSPFFPLID